MIVSRSSLKVSVPVLLPGETVKIEEACAPGKANYRGYVAVLQFGGKVITTTGSDARMESLAGGW